MTRYWPVGRRWAPPWSSLAAAMALRAASAAARPSKAASLPCTDQPLPLAFCRSTMAVAKAIRRVFCSDCGWGRRVEAIAIRDWSSTTSPPSIRPRSGTRSGWPARVASSSAEPKASRARSIIRQPESTSASLSRFIMAGSYPALGLGGVGVGGGMISSGWGRETNSGSWTAPARALSRARRTPSRDRSLGSLPKPVRGRLPASGAG